MVNAHTTVFIVHTSGDAIVPASQATLFYEALLRAGIAAELHIFNDGQHGWDCVGDPMWAHGPSCYGVGYGGAVFAASADHAVAR